MPHCFDVAILLFHWLVPQNMPHSFDVALLLFHWLLPQNMPHCFDVVLLLFHWLLPQNMPHCFDVALLLFHWLLPQNMPHCFDVALILFHYALWLEGFRIQPTFAPVRLVRGDLSWDINCSITPAHCILGLLAFSEEYEFGQLGTMLSWYCSKGGWVLLKEPTASLRGHHELQP